jgi:hypothetical protein
MALTYYLYINGELVTDEISGLLYELTDALLDYDTEFTWRADVVNEFGITTGDNWTFTTIAFVPPIASYILIEGGNGKGPNDDPPGIEWVDWKWSGLNNMITIKRLVAAIDNRLFYESI